MEFFPHLAAITIAGMHPFPAIGYGLMVSLALHLIVNPFTKSEPEAHLERIFGKRWAGRM